MVFQPLPLLVQTCPKEIMKENETFLICEAVYIFCGIIAAYHGFKSPKNTLLFLSTAIGCGLIEMLTIANDQIGNFYHSRAMFSLFNGQEPIYMLCGFYWFYWYAPMVLSQKMNLSPVASGCFVGLCGGQMMGLGDTVGAKFLWWTWHNGEPMYEERIHGVPVASTFWAAASMWSLTATYQVMSKYYNEKSTFNLIWLSIVIGALGELVVMNLPFQLIYYPAQYFGCSNTEALTYMYGIFIVIIIIDLIRKRPNVDFRLSDKLIIFGILVLIATLYIVPSVYDPTTLKSTSRWQPYGDCHTKESSFWGLFERQKYVCDTTDPIKDNYDFHCVEEKKEVGQDVYTVCGTKLEEGWLQSLEQKAVNVLILVLNSQLIHCEPKLKVE